MVRIDISYIHAIFYVLLHGDDFQHMPCANSFILYAIKTKKSIVFSERKR